jgi:hypothetical protein
MGVYPDPSIRSLHGRFTAITRWQQSMMVLERGITVWDLTFDKAIEDPGFKELTQ